MPQTFLKDLFEQSIDLTPIFTHLKFIKLELKEHLGIAIIFHLEPYGGKTEEQKYSSVTQKQSRPFIKGQPSPLATSDPAHP